ncbi:MAG: UDP-N-acetylglucosamine 2-epimerase (non-hydrolyzing) [Sedimentisphaerales bacterium]|nr:UDP-N-acetylglucosamine 2-epimerase (non-hydrolyzing) [Sedimentisphaerales bacterium]
MSRSIKLVTVVGARPQFVKAAAVSRTIVAYNEKFPDSTFEEKIIHTGQHYDENMSKIFFDELEIPHPDYNLGVGSGLHGEQTGKMLQKIEDVLIREKPNFVIVYGDTNSTLAAALAAAKLHIPVAHIEAGLRSFNRRMPEEINRVLADHVSDLLFCPTEVAVKNLENEGISHGVYQVGDVMYDSVLFYTKKAKTIEQKILKQLGLHSKSYYLATVHRAENTDDIERLRNIFEGFNNISALECPTLLPLHPRTKKKLSELGLIYPSSVRIIEPVSYLEMIVLEQNARAILTDSGGIQKEAYWFKVPCITLREETEWVETVQTGWNVIVGVDEQSIVKAVSGADKVQDVCQRIIYGNGDASSQICEIIQGTS